MNITQRLFVRRTAAFSMAEFLRELASWASDPEPNGLPEDWVDRHLTNLESMQQAVNEQFSTEPNILLRTRAMAADSREFIKRLASQPELATQHVRNWTQQADRDLHRRLVSGMREFNKLGMALGTAPPTRAGRTLLFLNACLARCVDGNTFIEELLQDCQSLKQINQKPLTVADVMRLQHALTRLQTWMTVSEQELSEVERVALAEYCQFVEFELDRAARKAHLSDTESEQLYAADPALNNAAWARFQQTVLSHLESRTNLPSASQSHHETSAVKGESNVLTWSDFRSPTQWRHHLKQAGQANSESAWRAHRKQRAHDIDGSAKSCRISRTLAQEWGLLLPEFSELTNP